MKELSRRQLLKITAAGLVNGLAAACTLRFGPTPTVAPSPSETTIPTATSAPAPTAEPATRIINSPSPQAVAGTNPPDTPTPVAATSAAPDTPTAQPSPAAAETATPLPEALYPPDLQKEMAAAFDRFYPDFRDRYVLKDPVVPNALRVVKIDEDKSIVSEGQGYWELAAVIKGDMATFSGLLAHDLYPQYLNAAGLSKWQILADGSVPDPNSATDADLDQWFARHLAAQKNPQYQAESLRLAQAITAADISRPSGRLRPSNGWDGQYDAAYSSPGYYPLLKDETGNSIWDLVAATDRDFIDAIQAAFPNGKGLVPNWVQQSNPSQPGRADGLLFGWDAVRFPWRQAMAALWYPDNIAGQHAKKQLEKINAFFESQGAANIKAVYDLTGKPQNSYTAAAFVGAAACASIVSTNADYRTQIAETFLGNPSNTYFSDSLTLMYTALLGGLLPH
ncbi:glycosyl hydrolase family 8 [Patescibacteria group bacterium]|nr:glycosyl hydrolase family 8 [Patescibacteria group bacterium]